MTSPRGQRNDEARTAFAAWLATPVSERTPKTQRELARKLGVQNATLSRWRRHPAVIAVVTEWREAYRGQFAEVVEAMFRKARAGNVQAARLLSEILGELAATKIEQNNVGETEFGRLMLELRDMQAKPPLRAIEGGRSRADA